ncbi:MAG: helix-turn-helix domain-containing protein [Candidatus Aminicenantes bacterium]|nr:helix-turn-helix domain-containing protein [Candidatus Aminicenantes bacterium]
MPKEDYTKYFKVLEIDSSASAEEIQRAYVHLKKLYSADSIITRPINDEIPDDKKRIILKEIEEAYIRLNAQLPVSEADTLPEIVIEEFPVETQNIKEVRESMEISLNEFSMLSDIPLKMLGNLENEKFAALPEAGLVRWYVLTAAKILKLNPKETADEYMTRYRRWQKHKSS